MIFIENCKESHLDVVTEASCFYATELCPKKSLERSTINIIFEDKLVDKEGYVGTCMKNGQYHYDIMIDPTMNLQSILQTIAHEFVHVNQYMRRHLQNTYESYSIWKGKKYSSNEYYFLPWEVEANGISVGLYEKFVDNFKYRDKDWYFDPLFI